MIDRLSVSLPELDEIKAELSRRKLHNFLKYFAWDVLQPGTPFVDNWHIGAICEHLQAVHDGQIKRLIINMPFRMLKSTIVSQAFPAWEWITAPHLQFLSSSYARDVAARDAVDSRRIVESEAYQRAWGDVFQLTSDQNVKTRYENDHHGTRTVTSTESAGTGFGGNRIIVDDPVSALEANSPEALNKSIEWWRGTAATRLNNPDSDAIVVVHQRLNKNDLTGYLLAEEEGWDHLILPMRFESKFCKTTSIGFRDPRTVDGELIFPKRLPEKTVKEMEDRLGSYHTAAQLQQRPNAREGGVLRSDWFIRYEQLPKMVRRCVFCDTAQKTKERNDFSVFEHWGLGEDNKIYLLDLIRGKWEAWELEIQFLKFIAECKPYDERVSCPLGMTFIEDKSSGTGLIQNITKKGGIPIQPVERQRDKLTRAYDAQPFIEKGMVCVPKNAPYVELFCSEVDSFTKDDTHLHDDQIDPLLDAVNEFLAGPPSVLSIWKMLGRQ